MKEVHAKELERLTSGRVRYDQGVLHFAPDAHWRNPLFAKVFFSLFAVAALFLSILVLSISMGSGEAFHVGLAMVLLLSALWSGSMPFVRRTIHLEEHMISKKLFGINLSVKQFDSIDQILLTQVALLGIPTGKSIALVVDGKAMSIIGLRNQEPDAEQMVKALSGLVY